MKTKTIYYVTGATGHVGLTVVNNLLSKGHRVVCMVYENSDCLPKGVEIVRGSVLDVSSVRAFLGYEPLPEMDNKGEIDTFSPRRVLIHCAAKVSIESSRDNSVYEINVKGTKNVMEVAHEIGFDKVIYVSSVHAIPERAEQEIIKETKLFDSRLVVGQYAKSKAEATGYVLKMAERGLDVSIVHPSGVIGPNDVFGRNNSVKLLDDIYSGRLNFCVKGGYNFVDSRDVAEGIYLASEKGQKGCCYIMSGHYITVAELIKLVQKYKMGSHKVVIEFPRIVAKIIAPICEFVSIKIQKRKPILTPYAIYTLGTNANFSNEKAKRLGFKPRPLEETIRDMVKEFN